MNNSSAQKEGEHKRKFWDDYTGFLFTWAGCASSMGMSNFLVFPSLCAKHGGLKVFMIPYLFFIIFIAFPLLTLELSLGKKYWNGNPWPFVSLKLAGFGFATAYVALSLLMTYSIFMSWELMYAFSSFSDP